MIFRTTQKEIRRSYKKVISVNYCGLQSMLSCMNPIAYTVRAEGWASDIYEVSPDVAISTGYSPSGNVKPAYEVVKKYEDMAADVCNKTTAFNERSELLKEVIEKFIAEVCEK